MLLLLHGGVCVLEVWVGWGRDCAWGGLSGWCGGGGGAGGGSEGVHGEVDAGADWRCDRGVGAGAWAGHGGDVELLCAEGGGGGMGQGGVEMLWLCVGWKLLWRLSTDCRFALYSRTGRGMDGRGSLDDEESRKLLREALVRRFYMLNMCLG